MCARALPAICSDVHPSPAGSTLKFTICTRITHIHTRLRASMPESMQKAYRKARKTQANTAFSHVLTERIEYT